MALGLATIATIAVVALYGSAPSPTPVPGPRAPTTVQIAGLTSALAKDWGPARAADQLWMNNCYGGLKSLGGGDCASALRRQVTALQSLAYDVRAQRLAGAKLASIVDGRFLRSVTAAVAVKKTALARMRFLRSVHAALMANKTAVAQGRFLRRIAAAWAAKEIALRLAPSAHQDADPLICIQPVGAAIQRAMGNLSYPHQCRA